MRIAIVTIDSRGDAQPMVVLAAEMERHGHDVAVGLPPNLADFGRRAGLSVSVVGPDTQEYVESPEGQAWLAAGESKPSWMH